jgi:hypothetical protein
MIAMDWKAVLDNRKKESLSSITNRAYNGKQYGLPL